MNFFGHATIAASYSDVPAFILGAMLPDFANMLGTRPPRVHDADLGAGVRCHHATDDVFHRTKLFRSWNQSAFLALSAAGLRRGAARAIAHVGVEFLIDGALAQDEQAVSAYLSALDAGRRSSEAIEWLAPVSDRQFVGLLERLHEHALSIATLDSSMICLRLQRALMQRPRLCFADQERALVESWVTRFAPSVHESIALLTAEIEEGLRNQVSEFVPNEHSLRDID